MNSSQAKKIKIIAYLNIVTDKKEIMIKSPFNPNEKTASFKIETSKNIWYDHSQGIGGNILDLVMGLNNCNLSKCLELLSNSNFSFSPANIFTPVVVEKIENLTEIKKIQKLQNLALIDYLKKRKIFNNYDYLQEIYYTQKDKSYFALAFENDSNGYEVRNAYFKGCISSKDITTIKGIGNQELSIFEGFLDFLSALEFYDLYKFKSDVIILNSVSNSKKIEELIYSDKYNKIYLFLDNDKAGDDVKRYFYDLNDRCIDCSKIYENYKDFNEFLVSKKI
ncbi:MAG: DNA primase [Helicobacteraceae bacterium]|nr:DNA primase [Helicobacteraceae bacterium]